MFDAEKLEKIREIYGLKDDQHAHHNLDGALIDIERQWQNPDQVCLQTLRRVKQQLYEIEKVLCA